MRIEESEKAHGWRDVIAGVLAAGLGVQSEKNRERDFEHGSPRQFAIVAIIATLAFIGLVYAAVKIVLKVAGV
mgnify:FL=1|jgi:uncharacterized membrane protein YhdT